MADLAPVVVTVSDFLDRRTSAVSTITAAYVRGVLLAELDDLAMRCGFELPRWRSANVPGGDDANAGLFSRYGPRVPELGNGSTTAVERAGSVARLPA